MLIRSLISINAFWFWFFPFLWHLNIYMIHIADYFYKTIYYKSGRKYRKKAVKMPCLKSHVNPNTGLLCPSFDCSHVQGCTYRLGLYQNSTSEVFTSLFMRRLVYIRSVVFASLQVPSLLFWQRQVICKSCGLNKLWIRHDAYFNFFIVLR